MKLQNVIHSFLFDVVTLATVNLVLTIGMLGLTVQAGTSGRTGETLTDPAWTDLIASMDKMHMAMGAVKQSGNSDIDFVRLMLPHHQAAVEMAKAELLYGKDAQMRRLAQEIITEQQLEIELMQRWLRQHAN